MILLVMILVLVFAKTLFAASCGADYVIATHNVEFDFNVSTATPNLVSSELKSLNANTFILSDDGNCYAGYEPYSRTGNDIYPLVDSSVLCPPGQFPANGTCTAYSAGTCPDGMLNTAASSATSTTWATMTNGACPSGYAEQTISTIESACDTYDNHITAETPACLLMCTNGNIYTELNSCAALCNGQNTLKTSTGLVFPMYATKQITPSLNVKVGNDVCYVNLVTGGQSDSINIKYKDIVYHTVK